MGQPGVKGRVVPGDDIIAADGTAFSTDVLTAAVTAARGRKMPIVLPVKANETIAPASIDYHGGLRYPHLEKFGTGEDGLDRLLAPR